MGINCFDSIHAECGRIHRILRQKSHKTAKKHAKRPVLGQKTSDYFGINIRTFPSKPPYFVAKKSDVFGFPAEKRAETPFSRFCNISDRGQGLVASEALLSPLTMGVGGPEGHRKQPTENIAHSLSHPPESKLRKQGIPPKKTNKT